MTAKRIKTKARWYQKASVRKAKKLDGFGMFMRPGTGKTLSALKLIVSKKSNRVLVIGPKVSRLTWQYECEKHLLVRYNFADFGEPFTDDELNIRFCNPERTWRRPEISQIDWDMVIVDESDSIANHKSKQSKFISTISRKYSLVMTGTPMDHNMIDLWGQLRFAAPWLFGTNFREFTDKWCTRKPVYSQGKPLPFVYKYYIRDDKKKKFMKKIKTHSYWVDEVKLPRKIEATIPVELPKRVMKVYTDLVRSFIAEYEGSIMTVDNALAMIVRLQQLTTGVMVDESGEKQFIDDTKIKTAKELILARNYPTVVFSRFIDDLDRLYDEMNPLMSVSQIRGSRKDDHFGKWDLMLVQTQSGGVSIDLTRSDMAYIISMVPSYRKHYQALKRVWRPPQEFPVTISPISVINSVDTVLEFLIQSKSSITDEIFNAMKETI